MTNIEKAQQKRRETALEKLVNTSEYGVTTKAKFMENLHKDGAHSWTELGHPFIWDRVKYNRMTNFNGEQDVYEKKYNQKVPKYYIQLPNQQSFYEVSKSEYDYFNELCEIAEKSEIIDPVVQSLFKPGGTLAGNNTPKQLNLF